MDLHGIKPGLSSEKLVTTTSAMAWSDRLGILSLYNKPNYNIDSPLLHCQRQVIYIILSMRETIAQPYKTLKLQFVHHGTRG
jgi:hypothetical protein